jgi:heme A synthase
MSVQRAIEYVHRITSGLSLILVVLLYRRSRKLFAKEHLARKAAFISVILIGIEALIGAGLVLLKLVAYDESVYRAISISVHLINTLALVATLTAVVTWCSQVRPKLDLGRHRLRQWGQFLALGFGAVGVSGAITALGDTLFPGQLTTPESHLFLRLRIYHPIAAIVVGSGTIAWVLSHLEQVASPQVRRTGISVIAWVIVNWLVGAINVWLHAPVSIQMIHLLLGNLIWISVTTFFIQLGDVESER